MEAHFFSVSCAYDEEASVWYVDETDMPGLVAEADKYDDLIAKVMSLAPELIELNSHLIDDEKTPLERVVSNQIQIPFLFDL